MIKFLRSFNKLLVLFSIFFIAFLGKKFALVDIPYVPGFVLDFILLLLLFFSIFLMDKPYSKIFSSKELLILSYSSIFLLYYLITTQSKNVNELGQDSLTIIYPVLIYCIYKLSKPRLNISENFLIYSIIIYSVYLFLDFSFERSTVIEKFIGINLTSVNFPSLNLVSLKPTEAIFYLSVLIFFFIKRKGSKYSIIFIFPGICFGLNMSDSRTVLYGCIIFVFLLIIENENNLNFKDLLFLFIGVCISFSFVITDDAQAINKQVSIENSDVGMRRIRVNTAECFVENLIVKRDKDNCERSQEGFKKINAGLFDLTELQGFSNDLTRLVLDTYSEIVLLYGSADNFNEIVLNCFSESPSEDTPCDTEALSMYMNFIQIRNAAYEELCGDNITWRINLWKKTLYNDDTNIKNILFGNGIGFAIPVELINKNQLPLECYSETKSALKPLRNAHNSYLTFYYRFGLINFLLMSSLLFVTLIKLYKKRNFSIIVFALITTFLDPILDSPISLFTFCFLIFHLLDDKET
tara:strand:+ start:587 stop:2155 length:1569 start_codon:yes stop_codon:yes gene_type:complete